MSIEDLPPGTIRKRLIVGAAAALGSAFGAAQVFKEPESLFADTKAPASATDTRPAPDTGPIVEVELASEEKGGEAGGQQ